MSVKKAADSDKVAVVLRYGPRQRHASKPRCQESRESGHYCRLVAGGFQSKFQYVASSCDAILLKSTTV